MKKRELRAEIARQVQQKNVLGYVDEFRTTAADEQARANIMERRANDAQQLADLLTVRLAQALTDNETLRYQFGVDQ